ncbi:hypothetical protein QYE76_055584 [Lolium multiflorum]|uniref:CCHC-type domain-containing protein n=1 Tax=Lolium multiflorum TaxID=4521 RepID=A0AAD8T1D0_LOLMU|nr:hypothetical protein QYE76_055584 [Lolium multiflorum]
MTFHAKTFWVDPSKAKEDNIKRNNSSGFKSLGPRSRSCYNCGDKNHFIAECPYAHRETRGGRLIPKDKSKDSKAPNKKFYNKSNKNKRPSRIMLMTKEEYSSDDNECSSDEEDTSKEVAAIVTTNIPSSSLFESPNENHHIKNAHCFMARSSLDTSIVLSTQEEYTSGDDDDEEDETSNGLVALASLSTKSSSPIESPMKIFTWRKKVASWLNLPRLKDELAKASSPQSKLSLDDLLSKQRSNDGKEGLGFNAKAKNANKKKAKPAQEKKKVITNGDAPKGKTINGLVRRFGSLTASTRWLLRRPAIPGGNIIASAASTSASPPLPQLRARSCSQALPKSGAGLTTASSCIMQEVMTTGNDAADKTTRIRGPALERNKDAGASASGAKAPPPPEVRAKLSTPLTPGADPTTIEKDLEEHRQLLLKQTEELAAAKRQWEISQREFNRAHGLTPAGDNPSQPARSAERRRPGRRDRPGRRCIAGSIYGATHLQHPDKNMLAAGAAEEPPPRRRRVTPPDERVGKLRRPTAKRGPQDTAESTSLAPSRRADSRNTHASSSRTSRPPSGNSGRSRPPSSRHDDEEYEYERPSTIKHRAAPEASGPRQPARSRLGPRVEPADAEIASTGWSNPASRRKKGQPAPSASGRGSSTSP